MSTLLFTLLAYITPGLFLKAKIHYKNSTKPSNKNDGSPRNNKHQDIKNLPELENLIFNKSGYQAKISLLIKDLGGNTDVGKIMDIGEFLGIEKYSLPGQCQYIRWEYINSFTILE